MIDPSPENKWLQIFSHTMDILYDPHYIQGSRNIEEEWVGRMLRVSRWIKLL